MLNIYKLTRNSDADYNTYESAIVCAESEYYAVRIHPDDTVLISAKQYYDPFYDIDSKLDPEWDVSTWAYPDDVNVELIGYTDREDLRNKVILCEYISD